VGKGQEKKHAGGCGTISAPTGKGISLDAVSIRTIFRASPIGVFIVQGGRFQFANEEFQRTTGHTEDELIGRDASALVHPEDWEKVRKNAIKMLKGERNSPYQYRVIDKAGEIKWIVESVSSISYQNGPATLGYFMDITEREHANAALALSEEKFRKAFRSSPDWIVITTLEDGYYVDVNEAFNDTTGYRRNEVIGRTSVELGIWVDPGQRKEMVEILREQGRIRNLEAKFRMKSGEIRHVLWSAEAIEYGEEKCLIAVTRDITERKIAEEERLEKEKLRGILEIACTTSHELNQPLQYIYYLLEEILEKLPGEKAVEKLKQQCDRMRRVMSKLENITTYSLTDYVNGEKMINIGVSGSPER